MTDKTPFILRTEVKSLSTEDDARRKAIIQDLSQEELDRVYGGTNNSDQKFDHVPDWDPQSGGDKHGD